MSNSIRQPIHWWRHLLLTTLLLALPFLGGAGKSSTSNRDENRQRIQEMTKAERDQLNHNFKKFRQLARSEPKTLKNYRDIQAAIDDDAELGQVARAYYAWLATLTLTERQRLESEDDPGKRVALIRKITAAHSKKAESEESDSIAKHVVPPLAKSDFTNKDLLSDKDLAAIMKIAEDRLSLQPAQRERLESMEGVRRYAEVFRIIVKQSQESNRVLREIWSNTELMDEMVSSISNLDQRQHLQQLGLLPKMQQSLIRMVLRSIVSKLQAEAKANPPTRQDLRELFFSLNDQERDQVMQLPKYQQRHALPRMYYMRRYPMRELASIMQKFVSRDGQPRSDGRRPFPRNRSRPLQNPNQPRNDTKSDRRGLDE